MIYDKIDVVLLVALVFAILILIASVWDNEYKWNYFSTRLAGYTGDLYIASVDIDKKVNVAKIKIDKDTISNFELVNANVSSTYVITTDGKESNLSVDIVSDDDENADNETADSNYLQTSVPKIKDNEQPDDQQQVYKIRFKNYTYTLDKTFYTVYKDDSDNLQIEPKRLCTNDGDVLPLTPKGLYLFTVEKFGHLGYSVGAKSEDDTTQHDDYYILCKGTESSIVLKSDYQEEDTKHNQTTYLEKIKRVQHDGDQARINKRRLRFGRGRSQFRTDAIALFRTIV